jgi:hypothetical protein
MVHRYAHRTGIPSSVVAAFPYPIRIIVTDNGVPFADLNNLNGPTARLRGHLFDRVCREHGIEHSRHCDGELL